MNRTCLLSALLLSACAAEGGAAPVAQKVAALDEAVWISANPDLLPFARELAAQRKFTLEERSGPDAVALRLPGSLLAELSDIAHEERGTCGGYMQHETEADALAAIAPAASDVAAFRLAPSYTIDRDATVKAMMAKVQEDGILATIRKLSSYRNRFHTSMTGAQASMWIRDTWQALAKDRTDVTVKLVDHTRTPQPSIELTIRGRTQPEQIVVLGGHMDSISGRGGNNVLAPGADDNASGIAVLTEILRIAFELGYQPDRTVKVYGYAAEEIGLVGSAEIAAQAKTDKLEVVAVMQLDMTNYTSNSSPYMALINDNVDSTLNQFSVKLIETYLKFPWKYTSCGYACSDHASWTKNGFPAVFPNEATLQEGNKRIHTEMDTLMLSGDRATHSLHFAKFGAAFLVETAKGELGLTAGCSAQKPCAPGERCDSGQCVADPAPTDPATCDSSSPCPNGMICRAGMCMAGAAVSPDDAGARDAVASGGPAKGADAGSARTPTTDARVASRDASAQEQPEEDDDEPSDDDADDSHEEKEPELDQDESAATAGAREGGCSAGAHGGSQGSLALLLLALAKLAQRRKRTAHR